MIDKIQICYKVLFFDGQIKHTTKVAQEELNCNFILLMSRKHICIMHMHYEYDYDNDYSLTLLLLLYCHNHNHNHNDNA